MIEHQVRPHPSSARLPREQQLAWRLAAVATDHVEVLPEVTEMVINRVIDDAAVAAASLARGPVGRARTSAAASVLPWGRSVGGGAGGAGVTGVGGVGERCRGAGAGIPRHVPSRRLLPPWGQHPAAGRGRPAHRPVRR
jgi:hypothetical protein